MVFMFELLAMHRMAQGISRHSEKSRCHYMVGWSSSSVGRTELWKLQLLRRPPRVQVRPNLGR